MLYGSARGRPGVVVRASYDDARTTCRYSFKTCRAFLNPAAPLFSSSTCRRCTEPRLVRGRLIRRLYLRNAPRRGLRR